MNQTIDTPTKKQVAASEAMEHLRAIKNALKQGADYDAAEQAAKPYIDAINARAKEIAVTYGVKPKLISFVSYVR